MATNRAIKSQITMEEQGDTSKLFVKHIESEVGQGSHFSVSSLAPKNEILEENNPDDDSILTINTVNISDGVVSRDHGAPSL